MTANDWFVWLLLFIRFSAAVVILPMFSMRGIPVLAKVGFAGLLALLVFLASPLEAATIPEHTLILSLTILSEVLVGLTLGLVVLMFFTAVRIAGELVDLQAGLNFASLFDPQYGSQVTLFGQFYYLFALAVYFSLNGHHHLLKALARCAQVIPPGSAALQSALLPQFSHYFLQMILIAFQLAMPVVAVLFFCDLALGLLGKTVPQLHVFMVGMPLKVGVALLIIYLILPYLGQVLETVFSALHQSLIILSGLL